MVPNGRHLASAILEFYFQFERAKTRPKLKKKVQFHYGIILEWHHFPFKFLIPICLGRSLFTTRNEKETGTSWLSRGLLGSLLGMRPSAIGQFFSGLQKFPAVSNVANWKVDVICFTLHSFFISTILKLWPQNMQRLWHCLLLTFSHNAMTSFGVVNQTIIHSKHSFLSDWLNSPISSS